MQPIHPNSIAATSPLTLRATSQRTLGCWLVRDRCDLLCLDLPRAEALRRSRLSAERARQGAAAARSLADPTRLMLAVALGEGGELCVCDLSWIAERPENLVSHHLRALRAAGLAQGRRDGRMVMYSLTARGEALLAATMGLERAGA
jgi:ArsR family transcriptional regulator, lead/cadmium/zinc/bismuth-responsive transcriptional repressor